MTTIKPLTQRQEDIFRYIQERLEQKNLPPTVREIGEHFNISSTNGVRSILTALIKKGYIKRTAKLSRGLEITHENEPTSSADTDSNSAKDSNSIFDSRNIKQASQDNSIQSNTVEIPIIGRVAAGTPIMAVQNLEGTVIVDRDYLMARGDVFALKVQGDSMIEAGIFDGDLVFAKSQNTAETGEIIVAQVEDEATVKYFKPQSDHILLEPANVNYRPITVSSNKSFSIAGKVIGVLRRMG